MIKFTKPKNLNGAELVEEIKAAGIEINDNPLVDEDGNLWLNINPNDEIKAQSVVAIHNGTIIAPALTIEDKLASVGLDLNDLKAALGL